MFSVHVFGIKTFALIFSNFAFLKVQSQFLNSLCEIMCQGTVFSYFCQIAFLKFAFFLAFFPLCHVRHHQEWSRKWWIKLWQIVSRSIGHVCNGTFHTIKYCLIDFLMLCHVCNTSFHKSNSRFINPIISHEILAGGIFHLSFK